MDFICYILSEKNITMATEQVRAFEVQIKGANSVKELKQEISALRDKLVSLDSSTKEYSDTVDELISDEKKLKEVMSAGKDAITGATGSYNALVNEMSALKRVWRELSDEGKRNEIGARIAEINNELKSMDSSIGNYQRNVGNYENAFKQALMTPQQELKKLKLELANLEQGTDEYNQTFNRMAQLTHDVTEQTEQLKWSSSDLGDILGNLAGVAQGVAGGFSAISALQGMIGEGNEDVEQAMLTTQRWIQLIQGLGAIEELTDKVNGLFKGISEYVKAQGEANTQSEGFNPIATTNVGSLGKLTKGFRGAMLGARALGTAIKGVLVSTGIGALLAVAPTVLSWLWKWVDGTKSAENSTKKLNAEFELLNQKMKADEDAWKFKLAILQAMGKSQDEIDTDRLAKLYERLEDVNKEIAKYEDLKRQYNPNDLDFGFEIDWDDEEFDGAREQLKNLKEEANKIREEIDQITKNGIARLYQAESDAKKLGADAAHYLLSDLEKLKKQYDEDLKKLNNIADEKERQEAITAVTAKYNAERKKIIDKQNEEAKKANDKKLQDQKTANEKLLKEEENYWKSIRNVEQKQLELLESNSEEYFNKKIEMAENYTSAIIDAMDKINSGQDSTKVLSNFNIANGTNINTLEELSTELGVSSKNIKDLKNELLELQSSKVMESLSKETDKFATSLDNSLNALDLQTQLKASDSFFEGLSPSEMRSEMDARYQIQAEYLQKELDLYIQASQQKNLTDEDRQTIVDRINTIQMQQMDLVTQKTIESNNLQLQSYQNMADSMMGISQSVGDVLDTLGGMIMDNAEAQLEAGEITQEEYERQFEKAKAFQTAQAIINTIAGAVGAFMGITKDTGGWGIALAIAQATAVFASGMAQVKKIQDTKPNTKSSSNSSVANYAEVTPNATSDYRPELTQNATGGQETENLANALSKNPIKAYVLESDISTAQAKVQQRNKESTF